MLILNPQPLCSLALGAGFPTVGACSMYRASAIVIFVCSLAIVGLAMFTTDKGQAAWGVVGVFIALQVWFFDRGQRKRLKEYAQAEAERATRRAVRGAVVPRRHGFGELVAQAERNLSSSGFDVSRTVALPNGDSASLVASRAEFSLPGLAKVSIIEYLFLQHRPNATTVDFDTLFEEGFQYAGGKLSRLPWPPRSGHLVLPCLAVDAATPELIAFASGRPPKRWMRFEFPVLVDLSTGLTYCCTKTPALGAMFFPSARALVNLAFDTELSSTSP